MEIIKVKLKGNESFSIREGWLTKGIFAVKSDSKVFSREDATDILGMGSNMVKSLKYWLQASGLIKETKKTEYALSDMGELILKYDPYFESIFTLFLVHLNISQNVDKAMVWNVFFNKCNLNTFSKKELLDQMGYVFETEKMECNEKMLADDIAVLLKTYILDDTNETPENNFACPLSQLKLVKKINKDTYIKQKADVSCLDMLVVYYALINTVKSESVNIDDLIKMENSLCKLLNLDKMLLNDYLDMLKKEKMITVNRTAGLNMVYINKRMKIEEIFKLYFERGTYEI